MRALLLAVLATTAAVAVGLEVRGPSPEELMVHNKARHLALKSNELWGFPASWSPKIEWYEGTNWEQAGNANCDNWTMTIDRQLTNERVIFVLDYLLPHEYAHFVYCFNHGWIGADPHDEIWAEYVTQLGGDPSYK